MGGSYDARMLEEQRKDSAPTSSQTTATAGATAGSASGSTSIGPNQSLSPGEQLKNGDYTLTYNGDGTLDLTDKDNSVLQSWNPTADKGASPDYSNSRMVVGSDGSLYITKDGNRLATLAGPAVMACYSDTGLSLGSNGDLWATTGGKQIGDSLFTNSEIEYPLFHPIQESPALKVVLDTAQQSIASLAKPLRTNHPEQIPQDATAIMEDLASAKMISSQDHSKMDEGYASHQDEIKKVAASLKDKDGATAAVVGSLPDPIDAGLGKIKDGVASLNDTLKAASTNFAAAQAHTTYYANAYKFPASTEQQLVSSVAETLNNMATIVTGVHDDMSKKAAAVNDPDGKSTTTGGGSTTTTGNGSTTTTGGGSTTTTGDSSTNAGGATGASGSSATDTSGATGSGNGAGASGAGASGADGSGADSGADGSGADSGADGSGSGSGSGTSASGGGSGGSDILSSLLGILPVVGIMGIMALPLLTQVIPKVLEALDPNAHHHDDQNQDQNGSAGPSSATSRTDSAQPSAPAPQAAATPAVSAPPSTPPAVTPPQTVTPPPTGAVPQTVTPPPTATAPQPGKTLQAETTPTNTPSTTGTLQMGTQQVQTPSLPSNTATTPASVH